MSVKSHFEKHKTTYAVAASSLLVGTAIGALYVIKTRGGEGDFSSVNNVIRGFHYKSTNVIQTSLERRGHPGNLVKCLTNGEVYASQHRAADALDIDPGQLSRHLNGHIPNVKGLKFEVLGEAQ